MHDKQRWITATVSLVVLVMSLAYVMHRAVGSGQSDSRSNVFYYDVDAAVLFAAEPKVLPPIEAPSGGEGVLAVVMGCGGCQDEDKRFIAYLQKHSEEYKTAATERRPLSPQKEALGTLVRSEEDMAWHPQGSPGAMRIMERLARQCPRGVTAARCSPP